jgi:hypothetical protein
VTLNPGSYIWATRGHEWGFRFLRDGGYSDPLPVYEAAFSGVEEEREVCRQINGLLVLRFSDPDGRRDRAGRPISHDFVIRPNTTGLPALEKARSLAWESVRQEYAQRWAAPTAT